jgi:hypothetical protein
MPVLKGIVILKENRRHKNKISCCRSPLMNLKEYHILRIQMELEDGRSF